MNKKRFLSFRTKPRNPVKTVEWLQYFAQLEGQNYMDYVIRNGVKIYPVRRTYVKLAHPEINFETTSDPESNARQEKAIYELLGFAYIDNKGKINITKAGREILKNEEKRDELMLRQLLKYQFPNYVNSTSRYKDMRVFLLEVVLKMLKELEFLNRYEAAISLMFCCRSGEIDKAINVVKEYREELKKAGNREKRTMKKIFNKIADKYYRTDIVLNKISSHLTTMDALFRFLEYTSLFIQSGRANYTKISFREMAQEKINLLLNEYKFVFNNNWDNLSFFKKFGDPYVYTLPWDKKHKLYSITLKNIEEIQEQVYSHEIEEDNQYIKEIEDLLNKLKQNKNNPEKLQEISDRVRDLTVFVNEDIFVNITSKTNDIRKQIMGRLHDIVEDKSTETSLALWLENVTWKSLVSLRGTHSVKRNFKVEPDLSPRFFAPGIGNTPDVEFYDRDYVLIVEVTLTEGVQQWKAEGGSVVDHVNSFFEVKMGNNGEQKGNVIKGDERELIGLFIAKSINNRIMWLFYALNNNSWLNQAIPIIPLILKDYIRLMKKLYTEDIKAIYFEKFLWTLHREAKACDTVNEWQKRITKRINNFIDDPETYINFNF